MGVVQGILNKNTCLIVMGATFRNQKKSGFGYACAIKREQKKLRG